MVAAVRKRVAHWDKDRYFAPDIEAARELLASDLFVELVPELLPSRS